MLARSSSIDAVIRSLLVCALQASPRPDHALIPAIQRPFVPTTIRGELQGLSQPHDSQSRPARAQARWPCILAGGLAAAGLRPAGATDVHLTAGHMQEH